MSTRSRVAAVSPADADFLLRRAVPTDRSGVVQDSLGATRFSRLTTDLVISATVVTAFHHPPVPTVGLQSLADTHVSALFAVDLHLLITSALAQPSREAQLSLGAGQFQSFTGGTTLDTSERN